MNQGHNTEKNFIVELTQAVEKSSGHSIKTTNDFMRLSGQIEGRTGSALSVSTLKRIWGRVAGNDLHHRSTLDLLAKFCGYADYNIFLAEVCDVKEYSSSHFILPDVIDAENLREGIILALEWNPDRLVLVQHSTNGNFRVIRSVASKLTVGDTFHCSRMRVGDPCYLDNLHHEGGESPYYVMGLQGGLTHIEEVTVDE